MSEPENAQSAQLQRKQMVLNLSLQNIVGFGSLLFAIAGAYFNLKQGGAESSLRLIQHDKDIQSLRDEQVRLWQYIGAKK